MKVRDVISYLKTGDWVDWGKTRDRLLFGDESLEVKGIGICWVATNQVIDLAVRNGINLIISHENPFYLSSTLLNTKLFEAQQFKKEKLIREGITIYRCHDLWDQFPEIGIADTWPNVLSEITLSKQRHELITVLTVEEKTVREVAQIISTNMISEGQNGVYVIGDLDQTVSSVALGTGAATDVFRMYSYNPDLYIVSEDGINCWSSAQFIKDKNKSMIIVSHACCEKSGLKKLAEYIKNITNIKTLYLDDGINANFVVPDLPS